MLPRSSWIWISYDHIFFLDNCFNTVRNNSIFRPITSAYNISISCCCNANIFFFKEELFDLNNIAALIDKSKEEAASSIKKTDSVTQDEIKNLDNTGLSLSEEDALKAQIFGYWSIPLGLPYDENLLVRIKLELKPDGSVVKSEILDHARMNMPGQGFYKVLAESALRAVKLCQPLRVPTTGYERWKELQLNFDASEMLKG